MEPLPDPNARYSDLDSLARLLREHPESARVEWLQKAVPGSPFGGFFLARRVRLSRSAARRLVESTVERSNVSTVQWWLEFYRHACGLRRALMMLDEWRLTRPETFKSASSWVGKLPGIHSPEGKKVRAEFVSRWAKPLMREENQ